MGLDAPESTSSCSCSPADDKTEMHRARFYGPLFVTERRVRWNLVDRGDAMSTGVRVRCRLPCRPWDCGTNRRGSAVQCRAGDAARSDADD